MYLAGNPGEDGRHAKNGRQSFASANENDLCQWNQVLSVPFLVGGRRGVNVKVDSATNEPKGAENGGDAQAQPLRFDESHHSFHSHNSNDIADAILHFRVHLKE